MFGSFFCKVRDVGDKVSYFFGVDVGEFYILYCFYIDLCFDIGLLLLFFLSEDGSSYVSSFLTAYLSSFYFLVRWLNCLCPTTN